MSMGNSSTRSVTSAMTAWYEPVRSVGPRVLAGMVAVIDAVRSDRTGRVAHGEAVVEDGGERFAGKVAVVTGSTADPSIGRASALRLAQKGASVVINGRDQR